ncbi:MAG: PIG-L family deacetylase [Oscillospiraceae bacterium]|nr:PIG-L family deacetylase [Oscillospiraceae bacterium]
MQGSVLVFAPHNDDELLGAGGTLLKLAGKGYSVCVCEVTSGPSSARLQQEAKQAHEILGVSQSIFLDLPACELDGMSKPRMNSAFCRVVSDIKPEIVLIPHYGDMHLDHRWVAEGAMVAVRPLEAPFVKKVLAYETLSETEWNTPSVNNAFMPNVWVDISGELDGKLKAMECYRSQLHAFPHPRSLRAIKALAEYRGSTIGAQAAEAFILVRGIG